MASNQLVAFTIAAILLPTIAMAAQYIVGDGDGWGLKANYTTWASDKVFYINDTLVFNYQPPHNVFKVDKDAFGACNNATGNLLNPTNGAVTVTLAESGKKWYICGYGDHCTKGQKLVITVQNTSEPTPAPTPPPPSVPAPAPSSSFRIFSSTYQIFVAAAVVFAMIAI